MSRFIDPRGADVPAGFHVDQGRSLNQEDLAQGYGPSSADAHSARAGKRTASRARQVLESDAAFSAAPHDYGYASAAAPRQQTPGTSQFIGQPQPTMAAGLSTGMSAAEPGAGSQSQPQRQRVPSNKHTRLCDSCQECSAFYFCFNCNGWLCTKCDIALHKNNLLQRHDRIPASDYTPPILCKHHVTEVCNHLCASCQELCCIHCIVSGPHKPTDIDHIMQPISTALKIVRQELDGALVVLQQKGSVLDESVDSIFNSKRDLVESCTSVKETTRTSFAELRRILDQREKELLDNIDQFVADQQQDIAAKENIIVSSQTSVKTLVQEITQRLHMSAGLDEIVEQAEQNGDLTGEFRNALNKATNLIKFFIDKREALMRGKDYEAKSALAVAEKVAAEVRKPRKYYLDMESADEFVKTLKGLQVVLAEFGFKEGEDAAAADGDIKPRLLDYTRDA